MPVSVQVGGGGRRETTMDKILKGITVANQAFGIVGDVQKFRTGLQDEERNDLLIQKAQQELAGPSRLDLVKAGFREVSPIAAAAPAAAAQPGSPIAAGAPAGSPIAEVPRFAKQNMVELGYYDPETKKTVKGQYVRTEDEEKLKDREQKLRDSWQSNKTTQRTTEMAEAIERMRQLVKNPGKLGPAQLGVLYSYMKLIDPGSTVREGEFSTAETAGGWARAASNFWNKVNTGQRVDKDVINEFMSAANHLIDGQRKIQTVVDDSFAGLADQEGFKRENVILPIFKNLDEEMAKKKKSGTGSGTSSSGAKPGADLKPIDKMSRAEKLKELGG